MNAGRAKVEAEGECRMCGHGRTGELDAAHLVPRSVRRSDFSNAALIVPLCSRIKGGPGCHDDYDAHRIDLLGHLTPEEEAAAVLQAGGLESARRLLCPSDYAAPIAEARGLAAVRDFDTRPIRG